MTTHPTPKDALREAAIKASLAIMSGRLPNASREIDRITDIIVTALRTSGLLGEGAKDSPFSAAGADRALSRPKCEAATIAATPQPGTGTADAESAHCLESSHQPTGDDSCPVCAKREKDARQMGLQIGELLRDLAAAQENVRELEAWKESALAIEATWSCQSVARLLEMPQGVAIHPRIEPAILLLKQQLAASESARERLHGIMEGWGILFNTPPLLTGKEWHDYFDQIWKPTCAYLMSESSKKLDAIVHKKQALNPAAKAE